MKPENALLLKQEEELRKLIRLSTLTALPLHADFNYAASQWRADPQSQFWARTSIRCLCAAIEAGLFTFRKMAEKMAVVNNVKFDKKETEILTEQRAVRSKGIEKACPKFLPLRESVVQSFRLFAKAAGIRFVVDIGQGYQALCATFEVRNRLMHPKDILRSKSVKVIYEPPTEHCVVQQSASAGR